MVVTNLQVPFHCATVDLVLPLHSHHVLVCFFFLSRTSSTSVNSLCLDITRD